MEKKPKPSFIQSFIEENQKAIVLLLLLLSVIGGIVGFRYYKHTRDDPEFCLSCHLMQETFKTWQMSKHRDFQCQVCHAMSILEQNRLLISFVVKGTKAIRQEHGRVKPWSACRECHTAEVAQGGVTLSNSYGHARHVFMLNIPCQTCHTGSLHAFRPDVQICSTCHKDKLIHGLGMKGLSCLTCHSYGEKASSMISDERCRSCHTAIPEKGVMSKLKCFDCHHPHGKMKPSSMDCLKSCHGNESTVGQHAIHMEKAKLQCLDCHKAHVWAVTKTEARSLCGRCHPLKDPATFIY